MRFAPEFLVNCTLLMMKSYKAYSVLRLYLLLPLPSPNPIKRLLSSSETPFGSNELAVMHVRKALQNLTTANRFRIFLLDEMSITKYLCFYTRIDESARYLG